MEGDKGGEGLDAAKWAGVIVLVDVALIPLNTRIGRNNLIEIEALAGAAPSGGEIDDNQILVWALGAPDLTLELLLVYKLFHSALKARAGFMRLG